MTSKTLTDTLSSPVSWRRRPLPDQSAPSPIRARASRAAALAIALLLHGLALLALVQHPPRFSLEAAGRPASAAGVRVTLVSAPAPTPQPAPAKPAPTTRPVERPVAPRHPPVLASARSQSRHTVSAETPPVKAPTPPEPPAPTTAPVAPAVAQTAPAAVNPELDLPGARAIKDVARVACHFEQPPYPPMARRLHHEGTVTLRITIDATGRASQVDVDTSSGFTELDAAAVQALRAGRCEPYLENGRPTSVRAVQALTFNLSN